MEVPAESCPLHLGIILCMWGCVTWAESVGSGESVSQSGTNNPKIY